MHFFECEGHYCCAALSKDISVGSGGVLTSKDSSQTLRTGNIMNVQDLSTAYKLTPAQLHSFRQLVLAGDDGSTNIYEVKISFQILPVLTF